MSKDDPISPCATITDHGLLYAQIKATDHGFGSFVAGTKLYDQAAINAAEFAGRQVVGAAFIRACGRANVPYETMLKIQAYMPVDAFLPTKRVPMKTDDQWNDTDPYDLNATNKK